MAIDLGGTNLRVSSVELHGNSQYSVARSKVVIPPQVMTAPTYKHLFHFIATHVLHFMQEHRPDDMSIWETAVKDGPVTAEIRRKHFYSVGFTFSFTFNQHALDRGRLLYWTKAFNIVDALHKDPAAMLQEALDDLRLPLVVTALTNDTVGTLAARAYSTPGHTRPLLGAIFGTGTNGAYMEPLSNITKLHSDPEVLRNNWGMHETMALNTEWGGFDDKLEVLPTTRYDDLLDASSVNPKSQHFEKRVSGMYLGELLRLVMLDGMQSGLAPFDMEISEASNLYIPDSIDSSLLSLVVADDSPQLDLAREAISKTLNASPVSHSDARAVQILAAAIGRRAARLSAVAMAGVVIRSGRLQSTKEQGEKEHEEDVSYTTWCMGYLEPLYQLFTRTFVRVVRWASAKGDYQDSSKGTIESGDESSPKGLHGPAAVKRGPMATVSASVDSMTRETAVIDIGVDGSLFEFFPNFEANIRQAFREIPQIGSEGEARIRIGMAKEGSGVGAALIAWSALRG